MDMLEKVDNAIKLLDEVENLHPYLVNLLSECDKRRSFILHYIENNPVRVTECYRIQKELKRVNETRRKCKNDIEILAHFKKEQSKLCNTKNRELFKAKLHKVKKKQERSTFHSDIYSEEEWNQILGVVK